MRPELLLQTSGSLPPHVAETLVNARSTVLLLQLQSQELLHGPLVLLLAKALGEGALSFRPTHYGCFAGLSPNRLSIVIFMLPLAP